MQKPATLPSALPANRSEARSALWRLVEQAPPEAPLSDARITVGQTLLALNSGSAHKLLKRGISSQTLGPLSEFLGLGKGIVAEYLDLDRSTANRRATKGQLLPIHSAESVLRLLELDQMASDTFESEEESSQWLRNPHPMLDGETPLESAKTSYGTQRVKDILLAIRYGGAV